MPTTPTMFGVPVIPCAAAGESHEWHTDGLTYCPGAVVELETFAELDALAREHGVAGTTYATGRGSFQARRATVTVDGTTYTAPGLWRSHDGVWLNPGANSYTHSRDRYADEQAGWHYPRM